MVDPDDRIEVSTVTNYYKHQLKKIDEDTKLDDMLEIFKVFAQIFLYRFDDIPGNPRLEFLNFLGKSYNDDIKKFFCQYLVKFSIFG